MKPRVSVVIPTYNRATKILKPLHSIIKQTFKDYEIIIIDDGSTDDTYMTISHLIRSHNINYKRTKENRGPSAARNYGMTFAQGQYTAFLDSDDEWESTFLEKTVKLLDSKPRIGLAYCDSQIFNPDKTPYFVFQFAPYEYKKLLNSDGKIPTGSFLFRTECWGISGPFNTKIIRGEDFEWQLRFGEFFDFDRIPEVLHFYYRDRDGLIFKTENSELTKEGFKILNATKARILKLKFNE